MVKTQKTKHYKTFIPNWNTDTAAASCPWNAQDHSQKAAKRVPKPDVVDGYMEIASSGLNIAAVQMNPQCMWQHSQDCVTLH